MKWLLLALGLFLPALAQAQTATPSQKFVWDEPAADLATANALTYRYYPDGAATGTTFVGVVCTGATSPFTCTVPIPAFTPGAHTVQFTAANIAGESAKTAVFSFQMVVTPATPANIRIQ